MAIDPDVEQELDLIRSDFRAWSTGIESRIDALEQQPDPDPDPVPPTPGPPSRIPDPPSGSDSDFDIVVTPDRSDIRLVGVDDATIRVKAGTYIGMDLVDSIGATVVLDPDVVFTRNDIAQGYRIVTVENSYNCDVFGGEYTRCKTGPIILSSTNCRLIRPHVHHVGQEAFAVRRFYDYSTKQWRYGHASKDCQVIGGYAHHTGLVALPFGEGCYTGSGGQSGDETEGTEWHDMILEHVSAESLEIKNGCHRSKASGLLIRHTSPANSAALATWVGSRNDDNVPHDVQIDLEDFIVYDVRTDGSKWSDGNGVKVCGNASLRRGIVWDCADRGIFANSKSVGVPLTLQQLSVAAGADSAHGDLALAPGFAATIEQVDGEINGEYNGRASTTFPARDWHDGVVDRINANLDYWNAAPLAPLPLAA